MGLALAILDVLFPPRCAACQGLLEPRERPAALLPLCFACAESLTPIDQGCRLCGLPGERELCHACQEEPPPFDRARAVYLYGAAIADVLHRFKYEDHPELARPLADRMAAIELSVPEVVAPVPLHAKRRRSRTYDQALLLARELAAVRGWRFAPALLERTRATGRQVGRRRDERARNVAGAFRVRGQVQGRAVLLVDDVVTTGATAAECARVLKRAGARRVEVASVARAV